MICFKFAKQFITQGIFKNLKIPKKNSVEVILEAITYRAPQLWNLAPTEIKDAPSLSIFKEKIMVL